MNKAKKELESRIIDLIRNNGLEVDLSKVNVHTFHSYALDHINEESIVSANLLRYSIYRYLPFRSVTPACTRPRPAAAISAQSPPDSAYSPDCPQPLKAYSASYPYIL